MEVDIEEAKTHLSRLLERVQSGEEIVISKAGRPIARLVSPDPKHLPRKVGLAAGEFRVPDDFNAPLPPDVEESFWK